MSGARPDNSFRSKRNSHGLTKQSPKQQTPSKASPTHNSSASTLENFNVSSLNVESKPSHKGSPNSRKKKKKKKTVSTVSCVQVLTVCHSVMLISISVIVK